MAASGGKLVYRTALRRAVPLLFASDGHEPRRRRVADGVLLAAAGGVLLLAGLTAVEVADEPGVAEAFGRLLGWLDPLWRLAYGSLTIACLLVLVLAATARRHLLVRDVVLAGTGGVAAGYLLSCEVDGACPALGHAFWGLGEPAFPALRLALVSAVLVVAAPDLTRPARRLLGTVVGLAALGSVVLGSAYPSHALGGLAAGVAVGAAVRLAVGSAAGLPDTTRVLTALSELGIDALSLGPPTPGPYGASRYQARAAQGDLLVAVHGRDARDSQLLARLWRALWYRDPGPQASVTRRQQVEHEALMLFSAAQAGADVVAMVAVGVDSGGDALLVTSLPEGEPPEPTDAQLRRMWAAAVALQAARIGHGALGLPAFVAVGERVVLTEFGGARLSASDALLGGDLAELLVSTALRVGDERAVAVALDVAGADALRTALPFVQRAALTEGTWDEVHDRRFDVEQLRQTLATAVGREAEKVAELRRVSWVGLGLTGLLLVAVYLMFDRVADIGFAAIAEQFADARWGWLAAGLVLAQIPMIGQAYATTAAVGLPLPLGPTTLLQSAIQFLNLTVPSVAGRLALTLRFLTRQGVSTTTALTQGALDGLANFVVQILVLLLVLPGLHLQWGGSNLDASNLLWLGVAGIALAVLSAAVFAIVPRLRAKVLPVLAAGWGNVRSLVTDPRRVVRLLAGNAVAQLFYALGLGAALRAFGGEASVADLLFVNTAVSLFAGMVPVPGGVGVAEAGLIAGMVALGVPQAEAVAAATSYRIMTNYLPPIWGYVSLRWLTKHGYV